jgi:hypothetical protein
MDVSGRTNPRIRFIGYTKNERLDRRTASVYGDDIGLSAARARRAKDAVTQDPQLSAARSEHEGRGFVQSDDVVNTGFTQGDESFVRVQVVYDETLPIDDEGVDITRLTQELRPKSPYALNVMHITVPSVCAITPRLTRKRLSPIPPLTACGAATSAWPRRLAGRRPVTPPPMAPCAAGLG